MTIAAWPATVPQYALVDSYTEKTERNVSSFTPEVGPPLTRRRSSISGDILAFDTNMALGEFDDLMDFYRIDLLDGSLPFTRKHPRDLSGSDMTFQFSDIPVFKTTAPRWGVASMTLRLIS